MINVYCQIQSYDDDHKPTLEVRNHWNDRQMVVLELEGTKITVLASDLEAAIRNCTNTARF